MDLFHHRRRGRHAPSPRDRAGDPGILPRSARRLGASSTSAGRVGTTITIRSGSVRWMAGRAGRSVSISPVRTAPTPIRSMTASSSSRAPARADGAGMTSISVTGKTVQAGRCTHWESTPPRRNWARAMLEPQSKSSQALPLVCVLAPSREIFRFRKRRRFYSSCRCVSTSI